MASLVLDGFAPGMNCAAIAITPDGRFGYFSLRGGGLIAAVEFTDDGLRAAGSCSAEGPWVRHLALEGDLLHAANQHDERADHVPDRARWGSGARRGEPGAVPGLPSASARVSRLNRPP